MNIGLALATARLVGVGLALQQHALIAGVILVARAPALSRLRPRRPG